MMKERTLAALQKVGSVGSLPTFAAAAHEINPKLEGEWRLCGQSAISLR
jgi:hypothetical protein